MARSQGSSPMIWQDNRDLDTQPLLDDSARSDVYGSLEDEGIADVERVDHQGHHRRHIGVVSAVFIIFNRIVGTGIFATPSTILGFSGSVGLSLVMWIIGAIIASAGMQVYIIWGTALPRNGGEKNYLEHLFPKPKQLITSIYAANAVLLAYAAGNCLVFAEYTVAALSSSLPSDSSTSIISPVRIVAFLCLTGVLLLHGLHIPAGLKLQNTLGFLKIGILFIVIGAGVLALGGKLQDDVPRPGNFDSWEKIWEGSRSGRNVICACLYNVIWSYIGFSNANYALSEMQDPARTLRIAGPLSIVTVTLFYLFCNVAYFAAATKEEITGSGRLVAALLFRNVWGSSTERILNVFIALSALGNVLSVSFSQGRVNQALGREGVLPFSKFWASNWPAKAPLAGLGLHWAVCNLVIFTVPAGDAYNFVLNLASYPLSVINTVISFGLLYLSLRGACPLDNDKVVTAPGSPPLRPHSPVAVAPEDPDRYPTLEAEISAMRAPAPLQPITFRPTPGLIFPALVFGGANVFLFLVPLTRPPPGVEPYERLPYWVHAAGGWCIFLVGALWWAVRYRWTSKSRSTT